MSARSKRKELLQAVLDAELDYEDPVETILEQLPQRSEAAFKLYCQTIGRRCQSVEGNHSNALSQNLDSHVIEDVTNHYRSWCFHSSLPYVVEAPLRYADENDPATEIMVKKQEWRRRFMTMAKYAAPLGEKYRRVNDNAAIAPAFLVTMAEHLRKDPDPHFDSGTNWYYSGRGNLHFFEHHGQHLAAYSIKRILYISTIQEQPSGHHIEFGNTINKHICSDNIMETVIFKDKIALRTLCKVYLLSISYDNHLKLVLLNTFDSETRFTSVDVDDINLYVTHLDSAIDVINMETSEILSKETDVPYEKLNRWSCVRNYDENSLIFASKNCLKVYDKMQNKFTMNLNSLKCISDPCNVVSTIECSKKSDQIYVGTNHHLFLADLRYLDDKNKVRPRYISRWNHGMKNPPFYININDYEYDKEIICLNSQWVEDTTIIVNGFAEFSMMAYKPKSILHTYETAKLSKICIDPILPLKERLVKALVGSVMIDHSENFEVVLMNSLGDMYKHVFVPLHCQKRLDNSVLMLNEWSKKLYNTRKPMIVTDIIDVSNFWRNSKRVTSDLNAYNVNNKGKCKFDERKMLDYFATDSFAEGLLTAWNVNESTDEEDSKILTDIVRLT